MIESFFFFIGGVQPKIKILDETPRRCHRCGRHQAYLKRMDYYLSIFFIPVLKIKTGQPALICNRCDRPADDSGSGLPRPQPYPATRTCGFCEKAFPGDYIYCPICGRRL